MTTKPHRPVSRRLFLGAIPGIAAGLAGRAAMAQTSGDYPARLRLDWGYYSQHTLLIKSKGWLEQAFKDTGTKVTWVESQGSNNSLEFLKTGATDFAGSADSSAFIYRANGVPLKIIYVASWAGSSVLQVLPDSPIKTLADLKGKKIAATLGTGPYYTLVRALGEAGISLDDVKIVNLQHPDGFTALEQKEVDAYIGLDPYTATAQAAGARTLFYNPNWRTASVFSTTEGFLAKYPKAVDRVLKVWANTQAWIKAHPDEFADLVAQQTKSNLEITKLGLARRDWSDPIPGDDVIASVRSSLKQIPDGTLRPGVNVEAVLSSLVDPAPAKRVLG